MKPIGIGEVIRRIIGKCVMNIAKEDVMELSGCARCSVYIDVLDRWPAVKPPYMPCTLYSAIFEADETDGVLLTDASNAFNALNSQAALHNFRVQCPIITVLAMNTHRIPARLFITGGQEILSADGTTQGDPLAMPCWFADDASGAGSVTEIKKWWDTLSTIAPDFGYPNDKKSVGLSPSQIEKTCEIEKHSRNQLSM